MRKMKRLYIILIAAAAAAAVALSLLVSTSGKGSGSQEPERVVKAFLESVTAGDLTAARQYCDTTDMKCYLESRRHVMDSIIRADSSAAAVALSVLAETGVTIDDITKDENRRIVSYTLENSGYSKARRAVLEKEEGEWKITAIQDIP